MSKEDLVTVIAQLHKRMHVTVGLRGIVRLCRNDQELVGHLVEGVAAGANCRCLI